MPASINATKWGYILGPSSTTFSTARTSNGFSVSNNPSLSIDPVIGYTAVSGRGSLTHRFWRTYFTFDVSGISGVVTAASLNFNTYGGATGSYIVLESSAFGGSNSNLTTSDFYSSIDYATAYSSSVTGSISSPFTMTLNSTAHTDIQNNSWFICSVVQYANDYGNTAATVATDHTLGINFSTTPYLLYTETATGPADVDEVIGVSSTNISTIYGANYSDIDKIYEVS